MQLLPITSCFESLKKAAFCSNQIIIQAPTGSGKSTALPKELLDWPEIAGKILMLEPRRVATRAIANFIAEQLNETVGDTVGYRVRGEKKVSKNTRLEIVTEGILTKMIQQDPELTGISMIIFDEVHERHLTTDLGLALAIEVQQSLRDDLTLLLMSATLSENEIKHLLPDAAYLQSEGRSFAVDITYQAATDSRRWLEHLNQVTSKQIIDSNSGDILVFLPGKGEILTLQKWLLQKEFDHIKIMPLYGEMSNSQQQAVLNPIPNKKKVILATNVAESSLTIDGIGTVIDCGLKRHACYSPKTGISRLGLQPISQASATQRSGRAGRTSAGKAIRLWRQEDHYRRMKQEQAEICHADLLGMVHNCAFWGAKQLSELSLLTQAPKIHEQQAWGLLTQLEFVDHNHKITSLGKAAYTLGCDPRLAHMLLKANESGNEQLQALACVLAALIEARGLPRNGCDIFNYLQFASKGLVAQQVRLWFTRFKLNISLSTIASKAHWHDIGLLLVYAYPDRIAKSRPNGSFQLACGIGAEMHENDPLIQAEYIVIADLQEVENHNRARIYLASQLKPELFEQQLAYLTTEKVHTGLDIATGRFVAEQQTCIGNIVINNNPIKQLSANQRVQAIVDLIRQRGLELLKWSDKAEQLKIRLRLAAKLDDNCLWPEIDDKYLLDTLDEWLAPYLVDIKHLSELEKVDTYQLLLGLLDWEQQQQLKQLLPTTWTLATGTSAKINYTQDGRALLSARLQEMLGTATSPVIANGKLVTTVELLSPARRSIALTSDLASFWAGAYNEVKKEMRGKYPKHLWPDSPQTTQATKLTKKHHQ
ncbi:MAG: ATP-dependent helicase HrpB [Parashewanella sp.]